MNFYNQIFKLLSIDQKKKLILFIPLTLIIICLETLGISLIIPIISNMLGEGNQSETIIITKIISYLFGELNINKLIFLIITIYILKNLYFILYNLYLFQFSNTIQSGLSLKLMNVYFKIPFISFLNKNSAELLRNIQTECAKIRNGVRYIIILFSEILILSSIIFLICLIDIKSAISVLFYIFVIIFIYFLLFKNLIINLGFQNLDKNKKLIQNILENISASKIIRLSLKQEFYINKLKKNLHLFLKNNLIFSTLSLMPKVWIEIFSIIGICLFLFILEKSDYDKNYIITYLGFISLSLIRIIPSIMRISNSFQSLKYTSAAIEKIRDDVELIYNSKENLSLDNLIFKKKLVLQNVGFKFKNVNKWIFKNINLEIKNKENILIRGESGSGKLL